MSLPEIAGHELLDLVGSGGCGAVYRASAKGKACAVKVFSSMAINRKGLSAAMAAIQQMPHHRGILPVEEMNFERSPYYIVTPLVGVLTRDAQGRRQWQTPTLESLCQGGLAPDQAWSYIYQLSDALAWLHKYGVPHGNLRPSSILLEDDAESSIRLTDIGQGWVGGIHHLELGDHFMHLCPEQADSPDGVFAGYGPSWDVYAFGVVSYRLLTGKFPRGEHAWAEQLAIVQQRAAGGLAASIDSRALVTAIRSQPKVVWPSAALSKWDERRRAIIERALDLNPSARWSDMREVVREFEIIESDYLLEEAREQTLEERRRQAAKVRTLQVAAVILASAFILSCIYGFSQLRIRQKHETAIAEQETVLNREKQVRDARIATLTQEKEAAINQKKTADANLQHAQNAVDQFLTQLLQTPTSNKLDIEFSKTQLKDALSFCMTALPALEQSPQLGIERLRAYGNIGQIYLRLRDYDQALSYLGKARDQAAKLLQAAPSSPQAPQFQQWLGRYSLLLSDIHEHRGDRAQSLKLLRDATPALAAGLAADPANRLARSESARACLEYGRRTLQLGDMAEAEKVLATVPTILDPKVIGADLIPEEQFILARAKFAQGQAQREAGRVQDALTTLIDAVTEMGTLVMNSSPRNQDQALMLAEAYTELAELLIKAIGIKEAREAFSQAVPILLELNRLLPEWAEVKYWLARNYVGISLLDRDEGRPGDAVKRKQDAIELLNEILADEKDNVRYAFLLARARGEYAELMTDMRKETAALPIIKQAVEAMQALLARDPDAPMGPERRQWEVQHAQLLGVLGHTSQSLGKKAEARAAFEQASQCWKRLAGIMPGDEVIQQGQQWTQERLAKLK
jgi:serine/threonine protein kinase